MFAIYIYIYQYSAPYTLYLIYCFIPLYIYISIYNNYNSNKAIKTSTKRQQIIEGSQPLGVLVARRRRQENNVFLFLFVALHLTNAVFYCFFVS